MRSFSISSWNIQGLYSSILGAKSSNAEFIKMIDNQDIIVLLETWCRSAVDTYCPSGYREILLPSLKHSNVKHGRESGGVIVWYKDSLISHLSIIKKEPTHIWLKLKKGIINCETDVYICAAYTPPAESPTLTKSSSTTSTQKAAISRLRAMCCCVETSMPEQVLNLI